jgi:hypothetical protein
VHGITVSRRQAEGPGDPRASEVLIRRISIRYEDGRILTFVPEMDAEFFAQDDILRLTELLHRSSAALEWAQVPEE